METQTRDLHYQILSAVKQHEGTSLPHPEQFVMEVTDITPNMKGMQAIQGNPVPPGQIDVPVHSGVYLARTFHRRGDKDIAIYNICVMDASGAIRLLLDIRADTRTPGFAQRLRTPITKLIDEHHQLNNTTPPTPGTTNAQPQPQTPTIDYATLSANAQIRHSFTNAINLIAPWQTSQWTGWVAYLLEKLRPHTDLETYENFLEEVGDAIATRMVTGLW